MASSNQYEGINSEDNFDNDNNNAFTNHSMENPRPEETCVPPDEALVTKINVYTTLFNRHVSELQALIDKLTAITDSLETTHRNTTIGSISGGVIGAAGGITSIVGVIMAPFTLGISLIVTGIGVGVAVAGGITGAASNITDMVQQKTSRQEIEDILKTFQNKITPIIESLQDIELLLDEIKTLESADFKQILQSGFGIARGAGHAVELVRLVNVVEIGKLAAQVSKTLRVAAAMTGVVSGLFLLLDIAFITKDVKELNEIDKEQKDGSEKSDVVKFIQEMRNTRDHLQQTLNQLKKHKEQLNAELTDKLLEN